MSRSALVTRLGYYVIGVVALGVLGVMGWMLVHG